MGSDEVLGLVGVSVQSLAGVLVALMVLGELRLDETGVEPLAVSGELTELRAPVHLKK